MSKWQCCVCGIDEPCILHMVNDEEGFRPVCCPVDNTSGIKPEWHPVDETATNCNQFPKLTTEVFNRPDCPEWAKYAAVDKDGILFYFSNKPISHTANGHWMMDTFVKSVFVAEEKFDSTDWKNSLIERPAKLPDWCKPGEWCYCKDDDGNDKYFKITRVDRDFIYGDDWDIYHIGCKPARLRPWRGSESLNKVVISGGDTFGVVIGCTWSTANVSGQWINCKKLLDDDYKQPDGSHCGVLEHLENGEWVK